MIIPGSLGRRSTRGAGFESLVSLPPVTGLGLDTVGPFGCKFTFAPTTKKHTVVELQRKTGTGENGFTDPDYNAAAGWNNYIPGGMQTRHFTDLHGTDGTTYTYRARFAQRIGVTNTWIYGLWSYLEVTIPAYTPSVLYLSAYAGADYGERLRTALAAAKTITDGDSNAFVKISVPAGAFNVSGTGVGDYVLSLGSTVYKRIWIQGAGKATTTLNFKVNDGVDIDLDPETNYVVNIKNWTAGESGLQVDNSRMNSANYKQYKVVTVGTGTAGATPPAQSSGNWIDENGNEWTYVQTPRSYDVGSRGGFLSKGNLSWVKISDMEINGGCRPTGKNPNTWYTMEGLIDGWDTSHKGFALGYGTDVFDFIALENLSVTHWRGECIYSGTQRGGSVWVNGCTVGACNSSAVSMSADQVILNTTIEDFANAGNESALYFGRLGSTAYQNCIHLNVTFTALGYWYTPANNPLLINNPEARYGGATFGDPNTSTVYYNCDFNACVRDHLHLVYEQRNIYIDRCTLTDAALRGDTNRSYISILPSQKTDYGLAGGVSNVLLANNTFERTAGVSAGLNCQSFIDCTAYGSGFDFFDILVIENAFDAQVDGSEPNAMFTIKFDHADQDPPEYIYIEFCHNTTASDYWSSRFSGDFKKAVLAYSNTYDNPQAGGQRFSTDEATLRTATPDADVIRGHNADAPACEIRLNKTAANYQVGQECTIYGTWAGRDWTFYAGQFDNMPGDITLSNSSSFIKFTWNGSTWVYQTHTLV